MVSVLLKVRYSLYRIGCMTLISEQGVTVSEKINDVGALIEAEKQSKKSKMGENPTTFAYDVYYDYTEVLCSRHLCPS